MYSEGLRGASPSNAQLRHRGIIVLDHIVMKQISTLQVVLFQLLLDELDGGTRSAVFAVFDHARRRNNLHFQVVVLWVEVVIKVLLR